MLSVPSSLAGSSLQCEHRRCRCSTESSGQSALLPVLRRLSQNPICFLRCLSKLQGRARQAAMALGPAMYLPDGRPIGYSLLEADQGRAAKPKRRSKGPKDPSTGWQLPPVRHSRAEPSEEESEQLALALRAGRSRRRRYLHDSLLRDLAGELWLVELSSIAAFGHNAADCPPRQPPTLYWPAGPLTLPDIQGLFSPIPFGDPAPPSAFQLAAGRYAPVWDAFRSIGMDKQTRVLQVCRGAPLCSSSGTLAPAGSAEAAGRQVCVLHGTQRLRSACAALAQPACRRPDVHGHPQAWEQRRAEAAEAGGSPGEGSPGGVPEPAASAKNAVMCWSRIDRRTRQALKRAGPGLVLSLECSLLDPLLEVGPGSLLLEAAGSFLVQLSGWRANRRIPGQAPEGARAVQGASKAELDLPDAFHRLLTHGLARFHGLQSRSRSQDEQRLLQVLPTPTS